MRIAFAGTPAFAAAALSALINAGHEVCLVLTQPDRPSGRGMKLKPSAVKEVALAHGIPVLTPTSLSVKRAPQEAEEALAALENAGAEVLIVAAYGLILPQRALDAARGIGRDGDIKSMNIHGSILPRWRGAAPVQRAIEAGDAVTGITLMKMEAGLDTGPMILKAETAITETDTSATLFERLTEMGAELIVKALEAADTLTWEAQPEEGVTYAEKSSSQKHRSTGLCPQPLLPAASAPSTRFRMPQLSAKAKPSKSAMPWPLTLPAHPVKFWKPDIVWS